MADDLAVLRQQIDRLPDDVTRALRAVAMTTAARVKDRAFQILDGKTSGKAARIAAITIVESPSEQVFRVIAEGALNKPPNLALWFERGTRTMVARPFMRPAGDAETERYRTDSMAAAMKVADRLGR